MPLTGLASTKIVVVVDRDLAFIFALSLILQRAGFGVVPASSLRNAGTLTHQLGLRVDLLIISYEELLRALTNTTRMLRPAPPIIAVLTESATQNDDLLTTMGVAAVLNRPLDSESFPEKHWVQTIQMILKRY